MVKIDLGAHIDGYIVLAAHTLVVGADLNSPEVAQNVQSGRRAAVINAAYTAAEVAAKMIKNGKRWLLLSFSMAIAVGGVPPKIEGSCQL
jgi:methionine aminopeptidase